MDNFWHFAALPVKSHDNPLLLLPATAVSLRSLASWNDINLYTRPLMLLVTRIHERWNIKDKWGDHTATSFPLPRRKGQTHWLCPAPHCHSPAVGNVCKDSLSPLWHSGCSGDSMMGLLSLWRSSKRRFPWVLFQWTQMVSRHWRFLKVAKRKKKKTVLETLWSHSLVTSVKDAQQVGKVFVKVLAASAGDEKTLMKFCCYAVVFF